MSSSSDPWLRELNDASKLAEEINARISERSLSSFSGPDAQRNLSAIRRKITILGAKLDGLEFDLSKKLPTSEKELNRRRDQLTILRSKASQISSALSTLNSANRENLLGKDKGPASDINRTEGLDNHGLIGLQRQMMKEQDENLEKLEENVISTKHIALTVNEELDLHSTLLDKLDYRVEATSSRLHRVQKKLAVLNKRTKGGCSCICLLVSVIGIVILVVVVWALIKYL